MIEIMIVVFLMTVLLGIAIPGFVRSRQTARQRTCISNLRHIDHAKEQHAMENRLEQGTVVTMAQIFPDFVRGSLPACPGGGTYDVRPIGFTPTCTQETSNPPHMMDAH